MPGVRAMVGSLLQYQYFVLFLFLLCFFAWNESNAGCLGKLNSALGFDFKSARCLLIDSTLMYMT